ncbi:hypothetical protein niasHT_013245 [Heterodera trifolii]|uniref:Replication factor A C-terminal domain-containing protein n=1 Tax=Heterodera trifolii TaxID=157864 RepID=A0ABD2KXE7_9BILA
MSLSRFQIPNKRSAPEEEELENPKNIKEVISYAGAGTFYITGTIADLHYQVYDSCPLKVRGIGIPCRRKLPVNLLCESCGQRVEKPNKTIYLKIVLQDGEDTTCTQRATLFSAVAEAFLGLKAIDVNEMNEQKLYQHFEAKLGTTINAKVTIKEDSQNFTGFDWVITRIYKAGKKSIGESEKKNEDANGAEGPSAAKNAKFD